jgi:hypothetical protein
MHGAPIGGGGGGGDGAFEAWQRARAAVVELKSAARVAQAGAMAAAAELQVLVHRSS